MRAMAEGERVDVARCQKGCGMEKGEYTPKRPEESLEVELVVALLTL